MAKYILIEQQFKELFGRSTAVYKGMILPERRIVKLSITNWFTDNYKIVFVCENDQAVIEGDEIVGTVFVVSNDLNEKMVIRGTAIVLSNAEVQRYITSKRKITKGVKRPLMFMMSPTSTFEYSERLFPDNPNSPYVDRTKEKMIRLVFY